MADPVPPPPWSPGQKPAIGGAAIALRPETFDRHEKAVRYVEKMVRELPQQPRRGRTNWSAPGMFAFLKPGATITGCVGLTLGTGMATPCTRDGTTITVGTEDDVTVYNTCDAITGDAINGTVLALHWIDAWVLG
jgi:hypothetical protein